MQGLWQVSLEQLFQTMPEDKRFSIDLITTLDNMVAKITEASCPTSRGGRDTLHYALRYEKDVSGNVQWLVLSLFPLPYYFHISEEDDEAGLKKVPIDDFVRAAAYGTGAMFLNAMITNMD